MKKLILVIVSGLFLFGCHDVHIEEMNVYVDAFNKGEITPVSIKSLDTYDDSGTGNGLVVINTNNTPDDAQYQVIDQDSSVVYGNWQSSNIITGLSTGNYIAIVRSNKQPDNKANGNFTIGKK